MDPEAESRKSIEAAGRGDYTASAQHRANAMAIRLARDPESIILRPAKKVGNPKSLLLTFGVAGLLLVVAASRWVLTHQLSDNWLRLSLLGAALWLVANAIAWLNERRIAAKLKQYAAKQVRRQPD
jgi:hypothetical protein